LIVWQRLRKRRKLDARLGRVLDVPQLEQGLCREVSRVCVGVEAGERGPNTGGNTDVKIDGVPHVVPRGQPVAGAVRKDET